MIDRSVKKPIRFSHAYGITRHEEDDWFDPLLNEDTRLHVDPFLIFLDTDRRWADGHTRMMRFFDMVMKLLAQSGFQGSSIAFMKAKGLLLFPEPPEFCLGESKNSIFGSGSARGLQDSMLKGAADAIHLGIDDLHHFEELALFGEEFGPDRIGDVTCNLMKREFISYTQTIAERHGIELTTVNVRNIDWSAEHKEWIPSLADLPLNPVASDKVGYPVGVILTPRRFLRRMPNVNAREFWDYALANEGQQLRASLNYKVGQSVDRSTIANLARSRRDLLLGYLNKLEAAPKPPYDVDEDPDLIVRPADFAQLVADEISATPIPRTYDEFVGFVEKVVSNFKWCVEERDGWRLLWVDGQPRRESHVQQLFHISAVMSCIEHNVDLSPETNSGRGPVDFKMSVGWNLKVLIECKLAKSTSFWRNLENQTPTYAKAEGCSAGYFLVIQYTDKDTSPEFVAQARSVAKDIAAKKNLRFEAIFIDARPKLSASKVTQ